MIRRRLCSLISCYQVTTQSAICARLVSKSYLWSKQDFSLLGEILKIIFALRDLMFLISNSSTTLVRRLIQFYLLEGRFRCSESFLDCALIVLCVLSFLYPFRHPRRCRDYRVACSSTYRVTSSRVTSAVSWFNLAGERNWSPITMIATIPDSEVYYM